MQATAARECAVIVPDAYYTPGMLYRLLGLTGSALDRGRKREGLKFIRKGTRTFYRGEWLIRWLTPDEPGDGD